MENEPQSDSQGRGLPGDAAVRRLGAIALLVLVISATGCRVINCIGGTPVEKPCYCADSSYHGKCPDGGTLR